MPPKTSDGGSPTNALLGKLVLTPHQALGVKVVSAVLIGLLVVFLVYVWYSNRQQEDTAIVVPLPSWKRETQGVFYLYT